MTTILFPLLLQADNSLTVVLSQPNAVGLALGNVHCGGWENMDSSPQENTCARCLWADHKSGLGSNGSITSQWCQSCCAGILWSAERRADPAQGQAPVPWQTAMLLRGARHVCIADQAVSWRSGVPLAVCVLMFAGSLKMPGQRRLQGNCAKKHII